MREIIREENKLYSVIYWQECLDVIDDSVVTGSVLLELRILSELALWFSIDHLFGLLSIPSSTPSPPSHEFGIAESCGKGEILGMVIASGIGNL